MGRKVFKRIQDKIIAWEKKPTFWLLLIAVIIVFAGVYFYRDLLIHYTCLAIRCFFKSPEDTRNVIYLFAAVIGAYLLYWRTKIAGREANTSEKHAKIAELTLKVAGETAKATEENRKTSEKNIIEQRINLATEKLASEKPFIRSMGVSNLEEIALSHEKEREKVMQILSTRIRELAPRDLIKESQVPLGALESKNTQALFGYLWTPSIKRQKQHEDIENVIKALSNIRKLYPPENLIICALHGTDLSGVSLVGFSLPNFSLSNTNLTSANLSSANLTGAYISWSNFTGANFNSANLTAVNFEWSNFEDTCLNGANISNADFGYVKNLTQKQIQEAFYWKGEPPRNLPNSLDPPPMREKPKEGASTDILPPPPLPRR